MDVEIEQTVVEDHPVGQQVVATKSIAIDNHSDAMQCLKALQEYAMLNENFRAIGLLMQTEKAFSNPADVKDFEL
ncbi:GH16033 [Drosophila grimshawi]|uniref:GH16033 n=2 Tax=Drosophila grimshawi TaxID=7222 RepID=B4J2R6_DROGR|nr:GH16033 [Drosophila grimshawi]